MRKLPIQQLKIKKGLDLVNYFSYKSFKIDTCQVFNVERYTFLEEYEVKKGKRIYFVYTF